MCVALPVRSFSRNWINGKTMLSAIWLASSEWSEFSWTTRNRLYKNIKRCIRTQTESVPHAKHLEGFQFILLCTVTHAASFSCSNLEITVFAEMDANCRQCLCYIIKSPYCGVAHFMKSIINLLFTLIL